MKRPLLTLSSLLSSLSKASPDQYPHVLHRYRGDDWSFLAQVSMTPEPYQLMLSPTLSLISMTPSQYLNLSLDLHSSFPFSYIWIMEGQLRTRQYRLLLPDVVWKITQPTTIMGQHHCMGHAHRTTFLYLRGFKGF